MTKRYVILTAFLTAAVVTAIILEFATNAYGWKDSPPPRYKGCNSHACNVRVWRKHRLKVTKANWGIFNAISQCESHGDWHINTGNGYYGGIQFSAQSWYAVGGKGSANEYTILEQQYRGNLLQDRQGWGAWPRCRRAAGV